MCVRRLRIELLVVRLGVVLTLQHLLLELQVLLFEWLELLLEIKAASLRLLSEVDMVDGDGVIDLDVSVVAGGTLHGLGVGGWTTCRATDPRVVTVTCVRCARDCVERLVGGSAGDHAVLRSAIVVGSF